MVGRPCRREDEVLRPREKAKDRARLAARGHAPVRGRPAPGPAGTSPRAMQPHLPREPRPRLLEPRGRKPSRLTFQPVHGEPLQAPPAAPAAAQLRL